VRETTEWDQLSSDNLCVRWGGEQRYLQQDAAQEKYVRTEICSKCPIILHREFEEVLQI